MSQQTITIMMGAMGTVDFLSADYDFPASYTPEEYATAMDDLRNRWDSGERGIQVEAYTEGYREGMEMAAFCKGLSDGMQNG